MEFHNILALIALLLFLGVFSSKISSSFNVPTLLMFLGLGMLAGKDIYDISHQNYYQVNALGTVGMSFILYSGGLDSNFKSMRKSLKPGIILATLGVFVTAVILGLITCLVLQWPLWWGLLLGAVVSSTDAAAVFAILRSKGVSLKGQLKPALELESGSNDPMAAFLTLFLIGLIQQPPNSSFWLFLPTLLWRMGMGVVTGYLLAKIGAWLFNKLKLEYEGLYFVLGIALVLLAYGGTEAIKANGFMATYVCGITMGNNRFNYKKGLIRFSDGFAWLMQVILFMVLGFMMIPQELPQVIWQGLILALVLMFIARPAAVYLCLWRSKFNMRERTLISWVGLRGAAPIVLATFPLYYLHTSDPGGYGKMLFNIVFFIVITSVLIQGRTLMPLARKLKLDSPLPPKNRIPLELEETDSMSSIMQEFTIGAESTLINKSLAEVKLPQGVLVMLIRRQEHFILARGNTVFEVNDGVLMMGDPAQIEQIASELFETEL